MRGSKFLRSGDNEIEESVKPRDPDGRQKRELCRRNDVFPDDLQGRHQALPLSDEDGQEIGETAKSDDCRSLVQERISDVLGGDSRDREIPRGCQLRRKGRLRAENLLDMRRFKPRNDNYGDSDERGV